jgi:DNA-binding response OmpR family regulator
MRAHRAPADLPERGSTLGIVVLSGFDPEWMEAKALALGADRYLAKAAGMGEVRAVHALRRCRPGDA